MEPWVLDFIFARAKRLRSEEGMSFTTIAENLRAHGFNAMDVCQTLARLGANVSTEEGKLVIHTPGSRDVVLWH